MRACANVPYDTLLRVIIPSLANSSGVCVHRVRRADEPRDAKEMIGGQAASRGKQPPRGAQCVAVEDEAESQRVLCVPLIHRELRRTSAHIVRRGA
jgi:hypothetical protein